MEASCKTFEVKIKEFERKIYEPESEHKPELLVEEIQAVRSNDLPQREEERLVAMKEELIERIRTISSNPFDVKELLYHLQRMQPLPETMGKVVFLFGKIFSGLYFVLPP